VSFFFEGFTMRLYELENFREQLRQTVDPSMERGVLKDFADYVLDRNYIVDDYVRLKIPLQYCYEDLYENFKEDECIGG
jgi:hypothetical protein